MSAATRLLLSASALALASLALPATAQEAAQSTPATPPAAEPGADDIVITGVRASLAGAQAIKRDSTQVVDSIVAEDIGKLPDNTVSDALQRITGIQVQRGGGEASTVLIRGLPRIQSYINGREVFTGTGRGVQFQDIPSELVAGVDVYKTTTPELIEGSVSGLIDIRFRRPFDFDGQQIAGSARAIYGDQVGKWSYIGSGLYSNRWTSAGGSEFGILIGASFNKRRYEDQTAFNFGYMVSGTNPANGQPFIMPLTTGAIYNVGDRERPAGNISLQWKPTPDLEFYVDGNYTGFKEQFDVNFFIGIPVAGNIITREAIPGTNFAAGVTTLDNFTLTSKQAFKRKTDGYQGAFGGKWTTGAATLSGEVSYTENKVVSNTLIVDTFFIAPRIDYRFAENGTPNIKITGIDITDPNILTLTALFDNSDRNRSKQIAARGDLLYEFDAGLLSNLKVGARYARRTGNAGGANPSQIPINPGVPASTLAGFATLSPEDILDGRTGIDRFALGSSSYIFDNADALRRLGGRPAGAAPDDPNRVFRLAERVVAAYGQFGYKFDLGGMPVDGVAGVRVVNTATDLNAIQSLNNVASPIARRQNYVDVLPSVSVRLRPVDNVQVRLVAGKAITRPEFAELNPSASLMQVGNTSGGTGIGGNADLQRIKSDNYDATVEWYFSPTGSLTLVGFRRDLDGYIVNFAAPELIVNNNGQPISFQVARPRNTGKGKLQGVEVAYQQFFDFLPGPLSGFGAQANFTYSDSEFIDPLDGITKLIPQVSKYSYNLVAIYEKYGFSARLAYNWRSKFTDVYNSASAAPPNIVVSPLKFLDFSASYAVTPNITFTVDATNILDETYQDQFGDTGTTPRDTRAYDRTIGAGVRVRF